MQFDLVKDPDHTEEIDPVVTGMRAAIEDREVTLEGLRKVRDDLDQDQRAEVDTQILELSADLEMFRADLALYETSDRRRAIKIRYLPPAKLAELQAQANRARHGFDFDLLHKPQAELTGEELDDVLRFREATEDLERETVRWGVVGWDMTDDGAEVPFVEADDIYKGRAYKVADWRVVDIIALSGWLTTVSIAIWDMTRLGGERRKK